MEAIIFPFRVDPFLEENKNNFARVVSHESVSVPLGYSRNKSILLQ